MIINWVGLWYCVPLTAVVSVLYTFKICKLFTEEEQIIPSDQTRGIIWVLGQASFFSRSLWGDCPSNKSREFSILSTHLQHCFWDLRFFPPLSWTSIFLITIKHGWLFPNEKQHVSVRIGSHNPQRTAVILVRLPFMISKTCGRLPLFWVALQSRLLNPSCCCISTVTLRRQWSKANRWPVRWAF